LPKDIRWLTAKERLGAGKKYDRLVSFTKLMAQFCRRRKEKLSQNKKLMTLLI
jgi:DNA topoisomerase IB